MSGISGLYDTNAFAIRLDYETALEFGSDSAKLSCSLFSASSPLSLSLPSYSSLLLCFLLLFLHPLLFSFIYLFFFSPFSFILLHLLLVFFFSCNFFPPYPSSSLSSLSSPSPFLLFLQLLPLPLLLFLFFRSCFRVFVIYIFLPSPLSFYVSGTFLRRENYVCGVEYFITEEALKKNRELM